MTVAFTALDAADFGADVDNTHTTSASVAYQNNRLYLLALCIYDTAGSTRVITSVTGGGLTWVEVDSFAAMQGGRRVYLFRAMVPSGATSGTLTFTSDFALEYWSWIICESDANVDVTGTNGSGAIVQSAEHVEPGSSTSSTVTLSAFGDAVNNTTFATFFHTTNGTITPEGGYTSLGVNDFAGDTAHNAQYKTGEDTSPSASYASSVFAGGLACEVKAAASVAPTRKLIVNVSPQRW